MKLFVTLTLVAGVLLASAMPSFAQSAMLQQKVQQAKQLLAENRMQLARYTWQMQETVSVNGDVKKQDLYQVVSGPPGSPPVKTLIAQPVDAQGTSRQHGIRHRMQQDFENYAAAIGALVKSYYPVDPNRLKQLAAGGFVALKSAGLPGYSAIVISNYVKPGDSIVITFGNNPKALYTIDVSSYLDQPSNAASMHVRFARLPDGTSYAATTAVIGQAKNLQIVDQSSNFTPRQ